MIYLAAGVAYLIFGAGVAHYALSQSTYTSKRYEKLTTRGAAVIVALTWPVVCIFALGVKFAEFIDA